MPVMLCLASTGFRTGVRCQSSMWSCRKEWEAEEEEEEEAVLLWAKDELDCFSQTAACPFSRTTSMETSASLPGRRKGPR